MVYASRNDEELEVLERIVEAGVGLLCGIEIGIIWTRIYPGILLLSGHSQRFVVAIDTVFVLR